MSQLPGKSSLQGTKENVMESEGVSMVFTLTVRIWILGQNERTGMDWILCTNSLPLALFIRALSLRMRRLVSVMMMKDV